MKTKIPALRDAIAEGDDKVANVTGETYAGYSNSFEVWFK